jgi:hypothetical protein
MTGAGIVAASAGATAREALVSNQSADSEASGGIVPQPSPQFAPDLTTADIMVETLISWGATHCFGVVGDGISCYGGAAREEAPQAYPLSALATRFALGLVTRRIQTCVRPLSASSRSSPSLSPISLCCR